MIRSLEYVPVELANNIAQHLEDEDDLLALRMSCRRCNSNFTEAHLKTIYGYRSVFLVPDSVDNLVKISKHPSDVRFFVRELRFYFAEPFISFSLPTNPYQEEVRPSIIENHFQRDSTGLIRKMWNDSVRQKKEKSTRWRMRRLKPKIARALRALPNLQTVKFCFNTSQPVNLRRSEINLHFPSLGLIPGIRLPTDTFDGFYLGRSSCNFRFGREQIWTNIMECILLSGLTSIAHLTQEGFHILAPCESGKGGIALDWFNTPESRKEDLSTLFPNLKSLDLTYRGPMHSFGVMTANNIAFYQWIQNLGANLEDLSISSNGTEHLNMYASQSYLGYVKPHTMSGDLRLPRLTKLYLGATYLSLDSLTKFLGAIGPQLNSVEFDDCRLPEPFIEWFRVLQILNKRGLEYLCLKTLLVGIGPFPENLGYKISIIVEGQWASAECLVELRHRSGTPYSQFKRNLAVELDLAENSRNFWFSFSDGMLEMVQ